MSWRGWAALAAVLGAGWVDQLGLSDLEPDQLHLRALGLALVLAVLELANAVRHRRG